MGVTDVNLDVTGTTSQSLQNAPTPEVVLHRKGAEPIVNFIHITLTPQLSLDLS